MSGRRVGTRDVKAECDTGCILKFRHHSLVNKVCKNWFTTRLRAILGKGGWQEGMSGGMYRWHKSWTLTPDRLPHCQKWVTHTSVMQPASVSQEQPRQGNEDRVEDFELMA